MSKRNDRKEYELAEHHHAMLVEQLDAAKTFMGGDISEVPGCPLQVRAGERVFLSVEGAFLVEPRRGAGHWEGRSQGISVHVPGTKSMRYRVGANRGHFMQGEEVPTPIDNGTFVITNQRAVFIGGKQTREWAWSKLLGFTHSTDAPWTAIAVSNRQKTSGVLYDKEHEDRIRFLLDLAVARFTGTTDTLIAQIEAELATLPETDTDTHTGTGTVAIGAMPSDAAPPTVASAACFSDPGGRHQLRYWDGSKWTEHVSDRGVQAVDPIAGTSP